MYILYCIYIFEIQRKIDVASRVVTVQNVTFPNEKSNFLTSILMILSKERRLKYQANLKFIVNRFNENCSKPKRV